MKYYFQNGEELKDGILLLADELDIEVVTEDKADIIVSINQEEKSFLSVTLQDRKAHISYGGGKARFYRGLAKLTTWVRDGEKEKSVVEHPIFQKNGAMADMSSNGVMKVEAVKIMFRKMALMGFSTYMLYTEDIYEMENHPYFGHMRGRYSKEELKELDAYAGVLGIELIPCIQVLGHLATHLRWPTTKDYRDSAEVLLVGAKETYELIDDMLKTVSECFTTRRVHIGMDETNTLGIGRYLKLNGYRERQDIYFEHLEKVKEMTKSYGLEPMMWSDMFFRMAGKNLSGYMEYDPRVEFSDEVKQKTPKGVKEVFWDYYRSDENFYKVNIDKHRQLFEDEPIFAGGIWCWSGPCPLYSRSLRYTVPALNACRDKGVKEIFATIWGGFEHSLLPSFYMRSPVDVLMILS